MKQAEKTLRDAGWEQVARSDVEPGEEFYDIHAGMTYEARRITEGVPVQDYPVLRAPRPEPEYDLDTVARLERLTDGDQFTAVIDHNGEWHSAYSTYSPQEVEVLRVIAYPDGTTPESRSLDEQYRNGYAQGFGDGRFASCLDRDALIEGMVPRVAEHWYSELRIIKYVSPYVTTPPKWAEADDAIQESWKGEARDVLREAYEEATK